MMLKTMFDGYQTSFNIIQQHATPSNMVAKRVQHVGFNNVGWCCINMLDPFGRALSSCEMFTFVMSYMKQNKKTQTNSQECAVQTENRLKVSFSSPEAAFLLVSTKKSQPLARSNTGSPRFTDFLSLCACSESSLTNLIGSGFNLLCSQSHSKTECCWTRPEVVISWCWPKGARPLGISVISYVSPRGCIIRNIESTYEI